MFAVGAAIGSAVTWKVVKTKYERIAQEEIESVKEAFEDRLTNLQEQVDEYATFDEAEEWADRTRRVSWDELEDLDEEDEEAEDTPDDTLNEYARLIDQYTKKEGGAEPMVKDPYVIAPYDFGEIDGYNQISLTYYSDGILEDEDGGIVKDVDELLGVGSLNTFGEYEDDSVFVRNEFLKTDFEILKDYRTYDQANTVAPTQVDDE
jgi:hypothetical protein